MMSFVAQWFEHFVSCGIEGVCKEEISLTLKFNMQLMHIVEQAMIHDEKVTASKSIQPNSYKKVVRTGTLQHMSCKHYVSDPSIKSNSWYLITHLSQFALNVEKLCQGN